jgi:multiple sugar transport system permease protein
MNTTPKVTKESKNKIKVDFDRTPLKDRLKAKFLNTFFLQNVVIKIFRFIFLLGIAYVVLYPFFTKIAGSFMSPEDFVDVTVRLIPKNFSLDIYKAIWTDLHYLEAFANTLLISLLLSVIQTFVCCVIAYGLAKYKFKGNGVIFLLVMITMIIPHKTLQSSMSMNFTYFDVCGILSFLSGGASVGIESIDAVLSQINILDLADHSINLKNTIWPFIILAGTGLAFKNGLYVFMLRQFFRGIPDSLEESAYIDGSGDFRTFMQIILPMSVPMMITVFLFAFCWQWTDNFYTELFFTTTKTVLMPDIIDIPKSLKTDYAGQSLYYAAIRNTCGLCIIAPLVILYLFGQRYLVEGIERSGLTAE